MRGIDVSAAVDRADLDFVECDRLVVRVAREHGLSRTDESYLGDGTEEELRSRAALAELRVR